MSYIKSNQSSSVKLLRETCTSTTPSRKTLSPPHKGALKIAAADLFLWRRAEANLRTIHARVANTTHESGLCLKRYCRPHVEPPEIMVTVLDDWHYRSLIEDNQPASVVFENSITKAETSHARTWWQCLGYIIGRAKLCLCWSSNAGPRARQAAQAEHLPCHLLSRLYLCCDPSRRPTH